MWGGTEPAVYRESLRVWRDLVAAFRFVKPEVWREAPRLEFHLRQAADAWAWKLRSARQGFISDMMDREIHDHLSRFLYEYRFWNHKADCRVRREFGTDGRSDIDRLRAAIEARLSSFREWPKLLKRAKEGDPPGWSPSDRTQFEKWRDSLEKVGLSGDSLGGPIVIPSLPNPKP